MLELDSCAVDVNIPFTTTASIPPHSFLNVFIFLVRLVSASWLVTWHVQKLVYSVSCLLISFRCASVKTGDKSSCPNNPLYSYRQQLTRTAFCINVMLSFVFFLCVFCFVLFLGEFTHLPFTMFFNSKYSQQVPLINSNFYVFQLICIAKSNSS